MTSPSNTPVKKQSIPRGVSVGPDLFPPKMLLFAGMALVVVVCAVYAPSLGYQFILDDHRFIGDPRIQSPGHVWEYFSNFVWAQFTGGPPSFYRPIFVLWMRINFILNQMSPWGWHLLSIAKHILVAVLFGFLVWRLLRDPMAALLAMILFALHPAQTESVAWVTVPEPLMAIGVLCALLFYLEYVERMALREEMAREKSRKVSRRQVSLPAVKPWIFASVLAGCAALLAKETAVLLPLLIFPLAIITVPAGSNQKALSVGERLVKALRQTTPIVCVTLLYFLLRFHALGGTLGSSTQHLSWATVILSSPATLWFYAKVLFWPIRSYSFADPTVVSQFTFHDVVLPALGVAALAVISVAAWLWAWRTIKLKLSGRGRIRTQYALVSGALLLTLPLLLCLNLNGLNPGDFLHGRYTYLPSAGLMMLLATWWHLAGKFRLPMLVVAALLGFTFVYLTLSQERQWKDDLTVFTVAHELAPHNAPVARNLADAHVQAALQLGEQGRCSDAVPIFEQVTREYADNWFAFAALGDCLAQLNDLPRAEESLARAAELSHNPRVIQEWQELRSSMGLPRSSQPR